MNEERVVEREFKRRVSFPACKCNLYVKGWFGEVCHFFPLCKLKVGDVWIQGHGSLELMYIPL